MSQFADETMEAERSVTCPGSLYKSQAGNELGYPNSSTKLLGCQQSAVTAETVVRKEKVEEGKKEKQKHRRIGRRERRRSAREGKWRREINF